MAYLMGLDLGTSSVKAVLVDEDGLVAASAVQSYALQAPIPGWAEQDGQTLWRASTAAMRAALAKGPDAVEISALGLSGQMHGLVMLDEMGATVRPVITWADRRSTRQAAELNAAGCVTWSGNPASTGFFLPSLLWVREHQPECFRRLRHALLPKDYLRYRLCGVLATDRTDASGTLCFDPAAGAWSPAALAWCGLDGALLPPVGHSTELCGRVTEAAAAETGLRAGTPVSLGGGDGPMQLLGCGSLVPGAVNTNIGTASQLNCIAATPAADPKGRLNLFCHALPDRWISMGASLNGGMVLKWLNHNLLGGGFRYSQLDELAQTAPPGCDGLLMLPYLSGERSPHMAPDARAVFFGLTLAHDRSHLVRAAMEAVVFSMRDCLEIILALGGRCGPVVASGGGARSVFWRQLQADILQQPVYAAQDAQEAAKGAAITAGVGCGLYPDLEEACRRTVRLDPRPLEPSPHLAQRYDACFYAYQDLYRRNRGHFSM